MVPNVLYVMLGFLLVPVILVAVILELVTIKLLKREYPNLYLWFLAGALYSICFVGFALRHTGIGYIDFRYLGFFLAAITGILLKHVYGVGSDESAV